jgi:hypothetical protein
MKAENCRYSSHMSLMLKEPLTDFIRYTSTIELMYALAKR